METPYLSDLDNGVGKGVSSGLAIVPSSYAAHLCLDEIMVYVEGFLKTERENTMVYWNYQEEVSYGDLFFEDCGSLMDSILKFDPDFE